MTRLRRLTRAGGATGFLLLVVLGFVDAYTERSRTAAALPVDDALRAPLPPDPRLHALRDTLIVLDQRERQIRLLAGFTPSADSDANALLPDPRADLSRAEWASSPEIVSAFVRRANVLAARADRLVDSLTRAVTRKASTPTIMPTAGFLTSNFSKSRIHPILHRARPHDGIDVAAPRGTPIVAPAAGLVITVARESGYGLTVEIDHGRGIVTRYAHCSRAFVHVGERVSREQLIAAVGSTGLTTGPHLHYEIRVNGKGVDPLTFAVKSLGTD